MPKNAISRLSGKTIFSLKRKCQIIFQSDCAVLNSHQPCVNHPVSLHLLHSNKSVLVSQCYFNVHVPNG